MRIYCLSDIHGCLAEFDEALEVVLSHLHEEDVKLILLGDYVHGGQDNRGVIKRIMGLQNKYGNEKVIALLGNHDAWVAQGSSSIDHMIRTYDESELDEEGRDDLYISWIESLPLYYTEGNTIFVHAGIDETSGNMWEWETGEDTFIMKYPAEVGKIEGLGMKVVAGHIGTTEIAEDSRFHDIYYDGYNHYYIDGTVLDSGVIPVLMVDTDTDQYYRVTESGTWLVQPYDE